MMFTDEQKTELAKPLNKAHVKPPAPGKYGEYIEGWRVIDEANRIFGFDGWSRETVELQELNRELCELTGKNGPYTQWRVAYLAKVRVMAGGIVREGTGCGHGQGKPEALGDAIESAVKESETDAMKRALMTFGNQFGLALYDKTKANVAEVAPEESESLKQLRRTLHECTSEQECKAWLKKQIEAINMLDDPERVALEDEYRRAKAHYAEVSKIAA